MPDKVAISEAVRTFVVAEAAVLAAVRYVKVTHVSSIAWKIVYAYRLFASRAIYPCALPLVAVNIATLIRELTTASGASLNYLFCGFLTLFYYSHISSLALYTNLTSMSWKYFIIFKRNGTSFDNSLGDDLTSSTISLPSLIYEKSAV